MTWDKIVDFFTSPNMIILYNIFVWVIVVALGTRLVKKFLLIRVHDKQRRFLAQKLTSGFSYAIIAIWIIFHLTNNKTDIAVAFWVIGAGIAFALQEVIASFAWWLAIMFGDFYNAWDRVQLWGIKGDIIDIWILRTTVMEIWEWVNGDQYNGRVVRIANSFVFKEPVYNYSDNVPFLWDEVSIVIKYGSDYDQAKLLLSNIARDVTENYVMQHKDNWENMTNQFIVNESNIDPQVMIQMMPYWLECTVRYIAPYHERRLTKNKVYNRIMDEISKYPNIMLVAAPTAISIPTAPSQTMTS